MSEPRAFDRIATAIESDWHAVARPEQLPPPGDWIGWAIVAGRGFGKTRSGAEWVRSLVENGRARRIALVGATAADVRDVMIRGESGLLSISPGWNRPEYEPSKRLLSWPNGAEALCFSAEEPDRLRGPQFDAAWCDELAAWADPDATWDQLMFGLRLGARPRVLVTTTPRPIKLLKALMARPDFVVTRGRTQDNAENLAPTFLATVVGRYAGTRLGRQELDAEILEDVQGALWSRSLIEECRVEKAPALRRIVVGIDPAVSVSESADETGIVVVGLGENDRAYVLADGSGKLAPIEWARAAIALYHRWKADRVIAEENMGGDLVEATLRMVDPAVSYKGVHATKGKITRAEPVAALYEQGRVHHVGTFATLEDQLSTYEPGARKSPDRLDALVWAITELMVGAATTGMLDYFREEVARRAAEGDAFLPPGWSLSALPAGDVVRLVVPTGTSTIVLMSGVSVRPDAAGVITCREHDARPLRALGWPEAPAMIEGTLA